MTFYQPLKKNLPALTQPALTLPLEDGRGELMGEGLVVILQRDPTAKARPMQNVVLSRRDLEAMRDSLGALNVSLEEGTAFHMGDGTYVIMQRDCATPGHPMQNVVLAANDVSMLLDAAA